MMSVVEDMSVSQRQDGPEPDPSWEGALADWDAGEPADLKRPSRKVTIVYRYIDCQFQASSPDLTGFHVTGQSLHEIKQLVRADLGDYLDSSVELDERMPRQDPDTEGASRQVVSAYGGGLLLSPTSNGRSRAFTSPSRVRVRT